MELPWQNANPAFLNYFWTSRWKFKGKQLSPTAAGRKEARWPHNAWERERLECRFLLMSATSATPLVIKHKMQHRIKLRPSINRISDRVEETPVLSNPRSTANTSRLTLNSTQGIYLPITCYANFTYHFHFLIIQVLLQHSHLLQDTVP